MSCVTTLGLLILSIVELIFGMNLDGELCYSLKKNMQIYDTV